MPGYGRPPRRRRPRLRRAVKGTLGAAPVSERRGEPSPARFLWVSPLSLYDWTRRRHLTRCVRTRSRIRFHPAINPRGQLPFGATSSSLPQPSRLDPPWSPAAWHAGEPADASSDGRAGFLLRLLFSCQIGAATHGLRLRQLAVSECLKLRQSDGDQLAGLPVNRPAFRNPPALREYCRLLP